MNLILLESSITFRAARKSLTLRKGLRKISFMVHAKPATLPHIVCSNQVVFCIRRSDSPFSLPPLSIKVTSRYPYSRPCDHASIEERAKCQAGADPHRVRPRPNAVVLQPYDQGKLKLARFFFFPHRCGFRPSL